MVNLKSIKDFIQCKILKNHVWTSKAEQGIKPTPEQINGGVDGFWDYAEVYCSKCGETSSLSDDAL